MIFFIIQVHKNIVKPRIRPHGNIEKIFGNVDNIFLIQNSDNFEPDFLKLYLRIFLRNKWFQKITPSMCCLYYIYIDFLA